MERDRGRARLDEPRAELDDGPRAVLRLRAAPSRSRGCRPPSAMASTMLHARSGSSSRCAPAPVFVTFFTGQPKLTSTMSAPTASTIRAASAIGRGSEPKSWIASGCSSDGDAEVAERLLVAVLDPGAAHHLRADEPGAVAASLAPKRLHADARHRARARGAWAPRRGRSASSSGGRSRPRMVLAGRLTLLERGSYHSRPLSGPARPRNLVSGGVS